MDKDKEKISFWAGTVLMYLAMFCLTIFPKIALNTLTSYVNMENFRTFGATLFILAIIAYLRNENHYKEQIGAIITCFAFYMVFLVYVS